MDEQAALFDLPAATPRTPPARLTPGEQLRARQAQKISRGLHPLTRDGWPPIPLHKQASLTTDGPRLRCGDCRFRQILGHHNRAYPKCVLPDRWGEPSRATHSTASDVRAWWPACQDYEPKAGP